MKKHKRLSELNRDELINLCRYYRGQKQNPYENSNADVNKEMLWFYESVWVRISLRRKELDGDGILAEYLSDYISDGLGDFRAEDNIPITLKALLYNRFNKDSLSKDTTPFKTFFNKYY